MQTDLSDSSLFNHKSVMTDEILVSINQYPLISGNKLTGIDATLGGGGHSYQLLKKYPDLKIIGLDHDPLQESQHYLSLKNLNRGLKYVPQILRTLSQKKKFLL